MYLTYLRQCTLAAFRFYVLDFPVMSSITSLKQWIQAQYHVQGLDRKGQFIGKKSFKARLIQTYPASKGEKIPKLAIQQLVNR